MALQKFLLMGHSPRYSVLSQYFFDIDLVLINVERASTQLLSLALARR